MKTEIKAKEFMGMIMHSNQSEIALWILSFLIFILSTMKSAFPILQLTHVARGIVGIIILCNLPKSYELLNKLDVDNQMLESQLYNDIMRQLIKKEVLVKIESIKCWLITYFILTFINFTLDSISFLYFLSKFDAKNQKTEEKLIVLVNLLIAFLFICNYIYNLISYRSCLCILDKFVEIYLSSCDFATND